MKRNILSVLAGLASAILVFVLVETLNTSFHPGLAAPEQTHGSESMSLPISFWLAVLFGWIIGSLLCGYVIRRIQPSAGKMLPIIAGIILSFSAIANFVSFPHPMWFMIIGLVQFIPSTLLGFSRSRRA